LKCQGVPFMNRDVVFWEPQEPNLSRSLRICYTEMSLFL
jgi:hypothetical protein